MSARDDSWKFPRYFLLIFCILAAGILTAGYLYFKNQERFIKKEKQQELAAIIALKVEQIISWRQERLDYAGTIMDDPFLALRVMDFLQGKTSPLLRQQILERLTALAAYQYHSLALVDPRGNVRLAIPASGLGLNPYLKSLAARAMQTQKVIFSDLYQDAGGKPMLSVLTPLLVMQGEKKVAAGVLLMRIEPYLFLFPLLKSWPTPSLTGETELVRRDGNEVVFLNELRHRQNIPLNLRFPVNSPHLLDARIARGQKGIVEGLDYRGAPVLAAAGVIPGTSWFLIAKIDAQEIYAPLKKLTREVVFLLIILIGTAGIGVAYFSRNQQLGFYRRQYEVERARRSLARRYEYLTRFANDIILVADRNLLIVEANDRAVVAYGYERHELQRLHLLDLYPPGSERVLDTLILPGKENSGLIFEAMQQRKDGTAFPVEVSLRQMEIEGEVLFQEIIRDITERRRTEEELRKSARNLRQLASQLLRAQEDERKRLSRELHDELGHALLALKLQLEAVAIKLLPEQSSLKTEMGKILSFMGATIEEVRRLYLDLSPGDLEDLGLTAALQSLVDDFADLQKQVDFTVEMDDLDGLFALPVQTALYRIVQEALTNIGKHAQPQHVRLKIKRGREQVSFLIEDDGLGFDRGITTEKKTLGLLAMEERVKILGGAFDLWSRKKQGVKISFTIPLTGEQ